MARLGARTLYLTLAALAACLACHPIFESDPYWHMSLGREVLRQGSRVVTERLAHPAFPATCVVPEWLWDVSLYGLHTIFGEPGVVACAMICAALFMVTTWAYLERAGSVGAQAIVLVLVLSTCVWRFEARPEMAALVILPLYLCLRDRFATCDGAKRRLWLTAALALLTGLWAQLHGSFVLAPVLIIAGMAEALRTRDRVALRAHGLLLLLVLVSCLTSAHGVAVANYILAHGSGDATRHITDMKSADLRTLAPFAKSAFGSVFLLWLLAFVAVLRGQGTSAEVASTLLGVALFFDAHRFAGFAAILSAKLALAGLAGLAPPLVRRTLSVLSALALAALGVAASALSDLRGPLLRWQRIEAGHPVLASRWLRSLPEGSYTLTDYVGGAELGFWLDGHVRTFVDGRTPMYFDDTDLAISRDLELSVAGFVRVRERYGFVAAVVSRHGYACNTLARTWTPVLIEGLYTTFVPKQSGIAPVPGLEPCGPELFLQLPCTGDGLARALVQLRSRTGDSDFLRFVAATREGLCGDAVRGLSLLPETRALWPLRNNLHAVRAHSALRAGDVALAEREIEAVLAVEPLTLMRIAAAREFDVLDLDQRRALLEAIISSTDDASPGWLRSRLAAVCAEQRDLACAYFHALRAAVAGERSVIPVLTWLAENADDARIRQEAVAYRDVLEQELRAP